MYYFKITCFFLVLVLITVFTWITWKLVRHKNRPRSHTNWTPGDQQSNPEREWKLMQQVQSSINKIEESVFCRAFFDQMTFPEISTRFLKVLGSEPKMPVVIYGIGSIESSNEESPRLQLSLAILMKRRSSWIGDIEVFDPVITLTESRVFAALGCSVLSVNEHGRRRATKPTLFFMVHCTVMLYENLLQANWKADLLNRISIFGNSFRAHKTSTYDFCDHLWYARWFSEEYRIVSESGEYWRAFRVQSWHFFSFGSNSELGLWRRRIIGCLKFAPWWKRVLHSLNYVAYRVTRC